MAERKEFSSYRLKDEKLDGIKPWMAAFMKEMPALPPDPNSNAKPELAITTHLVWDVEPDFEKKELNARATYSYLNKSLGNDVLILDVSKLFILSVLVNGKEASYQIIKSQNPSKSDAMEILIPKNERTGKVSIEYRTSPESTGVFWVDKEFTEGKKHPLVYTLFQAIEGASAIPGQHSPQVRLTYELNIKTKNPDLMALSSVSNNPKERSLEGVYKGLRMERAVPLYLLSLHIGNFTYRGYEADPRTGVYAEDVMIERVYKSLEDLPRFMESAEDICGPYNWGTYAPILLSWAFPYMAMEHPCASTCGAACLERLSVIPHELAHSWAGNDTTNCNWKQFFWNEGLTTFLEYSISERIWGSDYAAMEFIGTVNEAKSTIKEFRKTHPDFLRLCQEGEEVRVSLIPYGKGALFFFMLRDAMGRENFLKFLKDYMKVFFQNTMSEERFLKFLELWLKNEKGISNFDQFKKDHQIEEWLRGTEIPSNEPKFQSKLMDELLQEREKVLRKEPVDVEKISRWSPAVQSNFLGLVAELVNRDQFAALNRQIDFTKSDSITVRGACAKLSAKIGYLTSKTKESIASYVILRNSRFEANKIARWLKSSEEGKELIRSILEQDQGRLFPVTRKEFEDALFIETRSAEVG